MNFKVEELPSLSELIATMNMNPVGAAMFLAMLSILLVGLAVFALIYLHLRR